jgi:hypothetical protein
MEEQATRETAMQAMQPRRASQIFVLHCRIRDILPGTTHGNDDDDDDGV